MLFTNTMVFKKSTDQNVTITENQWRFIKNVLLSKKYENEELNC